MSTLPPILCAWDGEVFRPLARFAVICTERLKTGVLYPMMVRYDRSDRSHAHLFGALGEIWNNLPDSEAIRFPTVEHLRKMALIHTGWSRHKSIPCESKKEAWRFAAYTRELDPYCVVIVKDAVVNVYTAKSQSYPEMNKADFEASKNAVLDWASRLIETPTAVVANEAEHIGR